MLQKKVKVSAFDRSEHSEYSEYLELNFELKRKLVEITNQFKLFRVIILLLLLMLAISVNSEFTKLKQEVTNLKAQVYVDDYILTYLIVNEDFKSMKRFNYNMKYDESFKEKVLEEIKNKLK